MSNKYYMFRNYSKGQVVKRKIFVREVDDRLSIVDYENVIEQFILDENLDLKLVIKDMVDISDMGRNRRKIYEITKKEYYNILFDEFIAPYKNHSGKIDDMMDKLQLQFKRLMLSNNI